MSPEQLSKNNSESGQQKALFAWAAMAQRLGFHVANDMDSYRARSQDEAVAYLKRFPNCMQVPALRWLHAIPNGGARDPVTAARLKAEGVKAGVPDTFLPVGRHGKHGLYIEMKKTSGRLSDEQKEFEAWCNAEGFAFHVCYTWREAANVLQAYLT